MRLARCGFGNNEGKNSNGAHLISLVSQAGRVKFLWHGPRVTAKAHGVSFGFGTYLTPSSCLCAGRRESDCVSVSPFYYGEVLTELNVPWRQAQVTWYLIAQRPSCVTAISCPCSLYLGLVPGPWSHFPLIDGETGMVRQLRYKRTMYL